MVKILLFWVFLFIFSQSAYSDCYLSASERYLVPYEILRSIAMVESRGKTYALNVEGKSFYASTFLDAANIINKNIGSSFDVGIMQVNRWWFDKLGYSYLWGLNSCWNIHFGAYILGYELSRNKGDLWAAVGRYHSPHLNRQKEYINRVKKIWQDIQR